MLRTPCYRPWCSAAPWDPPVYALLTALSMQHCVLLTQCGASYRLYYALSKHQGSGVSVQKYQDTHCVRGAGDVLVLNGFNVALAAPTDSWVPLLHADVCVCVSLLRACFMQLSVLLSAGISGCFQLSVLIITKADLAVHPETRPLVHNKDLLNSICC